MSFVVEYLINNYGLWYCWWLMVWSYKSRFVSILYKIMGFSCFSYIAKWDRTYGYDCSKMFFFPFGGWDLSLGFLNHLCSMCLCMSLLIRWELRTVILLFITCVCIHMLWFMSWWEKGSLKCESFALIHNHLCIVLLYLHLFSNK